MEGLPTDFIEVDTEVSCKVCNDTGIIYPEPGHVTLCDCRKDIVIERYLKALPLDYRDVQFKQGCLYKGEKKLGIMLPVESTYIANLAENLNAGRALIYAGRGRSGKTTRVAAIMRIIINRCWRNLSLGFYNDIRMLDRIRSEMIDNYTTSGEFEGYLINADILVIDDFGVNPPTDYAGGRLSALIDDRRANLRPTFITTNYTRDELIERYERGAAIFGRLEELNDVVILNEKT